MDREEIINEMIRGARTAMIDASVTSNLAYRPEFISNDPARGRKVLVSIEEELSSCDSFCISVAFITRGGITPLLQVLKDLERKGVPGRILTTDYMDFSEPDALETLDSLENIELRMYRTMDGPSGFHTKGYIFSRDGVFRIIIGSSNMTLNAVTTNREWNTKIVSTGSGELAVDIVSEFEELWNDAHTQRYGTLAEEYRREYTKTRMIRRQQRDALKEDELDMDRYRLSPNSMQVAFIENLRMLTEKDEDRALLLSATGTGKTLASAFAMREMDPAKMLFLVHREQIAKQTIRSYRRVFGSSKQYGLLSGHSRETSAQYLFSTMQMMAKEEIMHQFRPDEFDVIILDECHHAGAESYRRIMDYFTPRFWLGMTASPDTNQYDIYSIFDHNIACEIRLQQALEEDLLCPFHYFGITDLEINGEVFDDSTGVRNFSRLVCDDRVRYIIRNAEYYGFSGTRVKGIVFCSRRDEAAELSRKFNAVKKKDGGYYRTAVLTGEDSQEKREEVIERLAGDKGDDLLDYVFTVDIFNEGVDIPEINQVLMLRPTQSPVVFIQQLGRGLRKADDKEYVVIIDFIGNYMNNFMIPIALSGDRSYNKDTIRRYVREGSRIIPGSSTVHFDEISKSRIYASIDAARTNDMKLIRESYQSLRFKLGRIPTIGDFEEYGSIDVMKIFEKCGSYHAFLKKYESEYDISIGPGKESVIEYMSRKLVSYKRVHELEILRALVCAGERSADMDKLMERNYAMAVPGTVRRSVLRDLTNEFPKEEEREKYRECVLVEENGDGTLSLSESFRSMLEDENFRRMTQELIEFGIRRYEKMYSERYADTQFTLYQKYTYEDVCRLLNWKRNMNAQNIGGYFYDSDTATLPVFINYHKAEDAIAYEDRFVSESILIALSKHPRKVTSGDADHIFKRTDADRNNRIYLFVRKNKDDNEAKEFYFLGEIFAEGDPEPIRMESTNDDAFEITYRLDVPVRSDIYDYIIRD